MILRWLCFRLRCDQSSELQVAIAYLVLKDDARRKIYAVAGFKGLQLSEAYEEWSVFDTDPWYVVCSSQIFQA